MVNPITALDHTSQQTWLSSVTITFYSSITFIICKSRVKYILGAKVTEWHPHSSWDVAVIIRIYGEFPLGLLSWCHSSSSEDMLENLGWLLRDKLDFSWPDCWSQSKVGSVEFPVGLKMWRWWSPVFCQCQAPVETRWTNAVDPVAAFVTLDLSLHEIFTAGCNWSSTQLCLFVAISSRTMFQAEWKHLKFIHPKQKAEIRD